MPSSEDLEKEIAPKPLQMYTKCSQDVVSTSLPTDPESITVDPDTSYCAFLPTDPPLSTIEIDTLASSDLNFSIAHQKGQRF